MVALLAVGADIASSSLGGDDRLTPFVGHLKQRVPSLTSIGRLPPSSLAVTAPPISPGILDDILITAGRDANAENRAVIGHAFVRLVKLKASQFIQHADGHVRSLWHLNKWSQLPGLPPQVAAAVLEQLAEWNAGVLPYIQDVPLRVRALILEASDEQGTFWDDVSV